MDSNDFGRFPPQFNSEMSGNIIEKETSSRYDLPPKVSSMSKLPFKETDPASNSNSFFGQSNMGTEKDLGALKLVSELLNNQADWKEVPDIVKWTIKALYDSSQSLLVNMNQGVSRKDVDHITNMLVSKDELRSSLLTKVNITDVSEAMRDLLCQIECKVDKEFYSTDINDKVSYDDFKIVCEKLDNDEYQQMVKKIDFETLLTNLNNKSNWTEVNEMLEKKVDKETIANALQKKINKTDFTVFQKEMDAKMERLEATFKTKLEQVIEAQEQVLKIVENENEIHHKKLNRNNPQLEDLRKRIDMKADRREIDIFTQECMNNVDRIKDEVEDIIQNLSTKLETHKSSTASSLSSLSSSLQADLTSLSKSFTKDLTTITEKVEEDHSKLQKETKKQFTSLSDKISDFQIKIDDSSSQKDQDIIERVVNLEVATKSHKEDMNKLKIKVKSIPEIDPLTQLKQLREILTETKKEIMGDVYNCQKDIDSLNSSKLNCVEFFEFKNSTQVTNRKLEEVQYIPEALKELEERIYKQAEDMKTFSSLLATMESSVLQKCESQRSNNPSFELLKMVNDKADKIDLERVMKSKVDYSEFTDLVERVQKDQKNEEVFTLLNEKAEIDHVNKALTEIHDELDIKANHEDIDSNIRGIENMMEALCSENCVGRWYWKSGNLKNDTCIPWEEQNINTCPENFLWEENKTSILTVSPGVYEINCALFSAKQKPKFDVMINGIKCISNSGGYKHEDEENNSKINNESREKYSIKETYSSFYNRTWYENDEGKNKIVGNGLSSFINLPANSRVYLNYLETDHAEGFLSMRKI
ncbi:unnamed protein product [Moneuplotes crassus]|uniref:Uncharacterized protein n=2 Tax=Euplotes crassus TaxID=5936 RepID=A0AAD1Y3K6_EUPCR|nr:unnamed protein product [Moneuplotes crassus]